VQALNHSQNERRYSAKVRVEPKTIHTADVDAFAVLVQRCCWSDKVSILF